MIKLVTISRISVEKGFGRMLKLESMLAAAGLDFVWDCYGDTTTAYAKSILPKFRHISFKGITSDPLSTVGQYDYLVQLSSTEGFCYSIYEALSRKVPVIATQFSSVGEMLIDGKNSYILKMDLSNFSVEKIKNIPVIKSFREKSTEKDWIKFLNMAKKKAGPAVAKEKTITVKVTRRYHDTLLDKLLGVGHKFKVTPERAAVLTQAKVAIAV